MRAEKELFENFVYITGGLKQGQFWGNVSLVRVTGWRLNWPNESQYTVWSSGRIPSNARF